MMEGNFIPCIPETAPFTPEQRGYLNGFLAGLFSRAAFESPAAPSSPAGVKPLQSLTILFGSQTGNAEGLAKRLAKESGKRGFAPTIFDLGQYAFENLKGEKHLLLITSTYGDGEPPDNAKAFWEFLNRQAPSLSQLDFSVLALGDSNYPKFCDCGKKFDQQLETLGARRVYPRVDCDVDFEEPFHRWMTGVLRALAPTGDKRLRVESAQGPIPSTNSAATRVVETGYSRNNPLPASLLTNRKLNGPSSGKDTRHFEISFEGSGLNYEVGDALGVMPSNCPELVAEIIGALDCTGEEMVSGCKDQTVSLREALLGHYEITRIPQPFLRAVAERADDDVLRKVAAPGANGELTRFLWGQEIIDLLLRFPAAKFDLVEFVSFLKKLQPRLYSISSSLKAHPGRVDLTVAVVRYGSLGRARKGVCSTFLAERLAEDRAVPVFVQSNKGFRLPSDGSRPMIMVGPGTGIAPFRAFLEERRALAAKGKNWLFFGDQRERTDFLYRQELEALLKEGTLTHLDTAFSRDQEQKIYVQQRMLEHAKELFAWLEEGAHFYVCGDAARMAKDVDQALDRVIQLGGGRSGEQAAEYMARLRNEGRYQRDVY